MPEEDTTTHTSAAEQPTRETAAVGRESAEAAAGSSYSGPAGGESPLDAHAKAVAASPDRPEIAVGAALVGGFLLAQILKHFGGED